MIVNPAFSVETFYGTLCSGLTEKTSLSFISSNSSFTKCVRNNAPFLYSHKIFPSITDFPSPSPFCSLDEDSTPCNTSSRNILSSEKDILFTFCEWRDITLTEEEEGGAAIQFHSTTANSKLTISHCLFISLTTMKGYGGAVDIQDVSDASVSSSSFSNCNRMDADEGGGGGVSFLRVRCQPLIKECTFFSCFSKDCGGVAEFRSCYAEAANIFHDNVCANCIARNDAGGALTLVHVESTMQCSNSLFCFCETDLYGGALFLYYPTSVDDIHTLLFCFFKDNIGEYGNDIILRTNYPSEPFLHCLSATKEKRVYYFPGSSFLYGNNWLPLTNINVDLHSVGTINRTTYTHKHTDNDKYIH